MVNQSVLAALAIAVISLLAFVAVKALLRRRRENWQFAAKGGKTTLKPQHADRIRDACRSGMTWTDVMNRAEWKYLAKYDGGAAWKHCAAGVEDLKAAAANKGRKSFGCVHGGCPNSALGATRPCLNRAKTRCCNKALKRCRDIAVGGTWDTLFKARETQNFGSKEQARVSADRARGAKVTVFEHTGMGGERTDRFDPSGTLHDVQAAGWNDKMSSIEVPAGRSVILYQHTGGGGAQLELGPGIHDLHARGWNDKVSSMRTSGSV